MTLCPRFLQNAKNHLSRDKPFPHCMSQFFYECSQVHTHITFKQLQKEQGVESQGISGLGWMAKSNTGILSSIFLVINGVIQQLPNSD